MMIRTKYVYTALAIILVCMCVWLASIQFEGGHTQSAVVLNAVVDQDTLFVKHDVYIAGIERDTTVRERLKEKVAMNMKMGEAIPTTRTDDAEERTDAETTTEETAVESAMLRNARALGDNRVSAEPRVGYLYACTAPLQSMDSDRAVWIGDGVWYEEHKPISSTGAIGAGTLQSITGDVRTIISRAYESVFAVPRIPTRTDARYCVPYGMVGIARDGVPIYAGLDAFANDTFAHEPLDACGASYDTSLRYYAESPCLFQSVYEGAPSTLLGYARDGFGIFSAEELGGTVTNEDLDVCHGHEHEIPWDGENVSLYHYHFTDEFPYSIGCFAGEPKS